MPYASSSRITGSTVSKAAMMLAALGILAMSSGWIEVAVDVAGEAGGVEADDVEIGALGALHLGEHLVDGADVGRC